MPSRKNAKTAMDIYTVSSESSPQKAAVGKKTFWHFDKEMLRFKLHFFLFMGALSIVLPYIAVFAKNRIGISATALAAVLMTQQFMFIVTKPIIGYIADYFNKLKAIICILTILQMVFFFFLLSVPKIEEEEVDLQKLSNRTICQFLLQHLNFSDPNLTCEVRLLNESALKENFFNDGVQRGVLYSFPSDHVSKLVDECSLYSSGRTISFDGILQKTSGRNCSEIYQSVLDDNKSILVSWINQSSILHSTLPLVCRVYCNATGGCRFLPCRVPNKDPLQVSDTKSSSDFRKYQFWLFTLFLTTAMTCTSALFTLSDTACCESVQKSGAEFGRQRLWGAVSWGLICPVGGFLNDYTGDYLASWILMAAVTAMAVWNMQKLDMLKPHFSQDILKDVGVVLQSGEVLAFEVGVLMNGIATGAVWYYLMWFLASIGGSDFLCGMAQAVQSFVGEIPLMFFSTWVIEKVGHFNILTSSLLSYCIRFFWYSRLHNPWLVLPVECLHGVTYGIYYPTVASYAKLSAKPGTEATTQSVLFTTHEGLGAGVGCVLAGLGFDNLGSHRTFFFAGIFAGCGAVLNIVLHQCVRQRKGSLHVTSPSEA